MSDPINESFSALLDDQATSMDVQRLLNAMEKQPNKVQQWQQLAQCQANLQQDVHVDLLAQIHDKLYDDPALEQSTSGLFAAESIADAQGVQESAALKAESMAISDSSIASLESMINWRKALSSIGVAATVCAVSLLGFYQWQQPAITPNMQADIVASAADSSVSSAQIQQRFQQLMQQRSQQASFSLPAAENQWQSVEAAQ